MILRKLKSTSFADQVRSAILVKKERKMYKPKIAKNDENLSCLSIATLFPAFIFYLLKQVKFPGNFEEILNVIAVKNSPAL